MRTALFFILITSTASFAQNTTDWKRYDELLRQKKFTQVYSECKAKLSESFGKTAYLNQYYIGQSLCGAGFTQQGIGWYNNIKEKFPLDKEFGKQLTFSISKCGTQTPTSSGTTVTVIINNSVTPSGVTGGVRGKSGFQMDCDKDSRENYEKLLSNDSLNRRVFPVTQKAEALSNLRTFLPESQYKIDTTGRFMLVYKRSQESSKKVHEVATKLETAYQFFVKEYQLRDIDKLFTVYLVEDKFSLQALAKQVHDITISRGNIGYSSLNDLSLLGIANSGQAGTLIHELFHLVIRSEVGDISPWLDEGMACMYSVYEMEEEKLKGSNATWRVTQFKMLSDLKSLGKVHVPSLTQLLNFTWGEYQGETYNSFCDASVNYALSNFFALYLQHKKLDASVIRTFKNRQFANTDTLSVGPSDVELLEKVFDQPINDISLDFYKWLNTSYKINMTELLVTKPAFAKSDLPAQFQVLLDSANTELVQLSMGTKEVNRKERKALDEEKALLFRSVGSRQRQIAEQQEIVIGLLSESTSASANDFERYKSEYQQEAKYLESAEKDYEIFLAEKEKQAIALINKIRSLK